MKNSKKPVFSLIIPTYNRADFLPLAIKSVLRQTFNDFELIVSNGGSTDNTAEVVAKLGDKRVRYFESKERLSIGDNYQNGLNHATGEYITFLGDDDAFAPTMLERVKRVIDERRAKLVVFRVSLYYHHDDVELHSQKKVLSNTLVLSRNTGEITKFEKREAIENLFLHYQLTEKGQVNPKFIVPYLANAVYHHEIFSNLSRKREKLFATTPADMYLAAAVFFATDFYYCLDEPLHVWSNWGGNSTASPHRRGNKLREHYEKLLDGATLNYTPLKFALPQNLYANAILQAKHDFAADENFEIDWASYYVGVYDDLLNLKSKGVETQRETEEFHRVLAAEPIELQQRVRRKISSPQFIARQIVRGKLPLAKNFLKRIIRGKAATEQVFVRGDEAGFKDFLEAAQFLESEILPKKF